MQYGKMTSKKQVLKGMITEVLAADGHYATYKAVSDFLHVHWRGLMHAKHDPRNSLNSRIVLKSRMPTGAVTWLPGREFDQYIAARLQTVLSSRAGTQPARAPGAGDAEQ